MLKRILFVALVVCSITMLAQSTPIRGTVIDSSGAVIPGVTVVLEHERGMQWQTITDEHGAFVFVGVPGGKVKLTASLSGFKNLIYEFNAEEARAALSIRLDVASVTEEGNENGCARARAE